MGSGLVDGLTGSRKLNFKSYILIKDDSLHCRATVLN